MRRIALILLSLGLAVPASAADRLGQRTQRPEQSMSGIGEGLSDSELERAMAAAAAHPLGTLENPIRAAGPEGERAYLARLRCANGAAPAIGASSPAGVGAYGTIVERYTLDCGAAAPGRVSLVMDAYQEEHVETGPPAGFSLAPR